MYAFASMTFCDNLLIGRYKNSPLSALTDVGPKRLKVRENARAFSREKKKLSIITEMSVLRGCV